MTVCLKTPTGVHDEVGLRRSAWSTLEAHRMKSTHKKGGSVKCFWITSSSCGGPLSCGCLRTLRVACVVVAAAVARGWRSRSHASGSRA